MGASTSLRKEKSNKNEFQSRNEQERLSYHPWRSAIVYNRTVAFRSDLSLLLQASGDLTFERKFRCVNVHVVDKEKRYGKCAVKVV